LSVEGPGGDETRAVHLISDSLATDGGYVAIADMARLLDGRNHRLIGGIAVMIHLQRLGSDLPLRATGDADFGIPLTLLRDDALLVDLIEGSGYRKVAGNRWARDVDHRRRAVIDLLIPGYTTRLRSSHQVGSVNSTEVPGLSEALRRRPVEISAVMHLTDGTRIHATIQIPDVIAMLVLKARVRSVRDETRDAEDVWRCLELVNIEPGTQVAADDPDLIEILPILRAEVGSGGLSLPAIVAGVAEEEAQRRRTRLLALLAALGA